MNHHTIIGGLTYWDEEEREWLDWLSEEGEEIDDYFENNEEMNEFTKELFKVNLK